MNLFQLFKKVLKSHLPVRINSKDGTLVLIPEEDYESLVETAELLSVKGFKESIKKADKEIKEENLYSLEDVFDGQ